MRNKPKFKQTEIGEIPEDWRIVTIPDVASNFDNKRKPLSSAERSKIRGKYPYYGAAGIIDYVNDFKYEGNYLLIAEDGTVTSDGNRPMLQLARGKFWVSNHAHVLQCKSYKDTLFLYYQLKNTSVAPFITGAVQPKLSQENLNKIKFPWIENDDERGVITKILSDLDEKIELNHQMNKTIESIAQAIFKRWFVDFKFLRHEKTKFVNGLPEKWRKGTFGELAKIQPGFAFKSTDFISGGYKVIKIANIQNEIVDFNKSDHVSNTVFQSIDKKFYLVSGDVVIAMTGAEIGKIGIIPKNDKIMLLNQRVGKLVSDYYQWAYQVLKGAEIQALIDGISSASSAQPNISNSDIEKTEVIIPDEQTLKHFCQITDSFFHHLISNLGENQILSQIRDSLLPRLMSGKVRVRTCAKGSWQD